MERVSSAQKLAFALLPSERARACDRRHDLLPVSWREWRHFPGSSGFLNPGLRFSGIGTAVSRSVDLRDPRTTEEGRREGGRARVGHSDGRTDSV